MTDIVPWPGDLDYGVTRDGRVFRIRKARFGRPVPYERAPVLNEGGYLVVGVGPRTVKVHRIVAETFLPNPEGKPDVAHGDGVRTNNRVENLRWATRKENMNDARRHGTFPPRGELCGNSILTEMDVRAIKTRLEFGVKGRRLAEDYGVSEQLICDIKNGRKWAHVAA